MMYMRLTRRFIVGSLSKVSVSRPIRYERYYINDYLRIQSKGNILEKEILDKDNNVIEKSNIATACHSHSRGKIKK